MKMAEFKALSIDEQITKLNKHLSNIKNMPGRMDTNFKNDEFEFSYSLLKKDAKKLGIVVDGKQYLAYKLGEKAPAVNGKQDVVKTEKVVKEQNNVEEKLHLTKDEILFVKDLFNKQELVKSKQTLFLPTFNGAKKTTGISVYVEIWERWGEFKKRYPMYSGTDLLALALEEFMEKYDEGSDS